MMNYASSLEKFTEQFEYVLEHYSDHGSKATDFTNILLGGLGGSGISADIAKAWFYDKCSLPIEIVHDYTLPATVSSKTFVVLSSYSGNTEETLSMYEQAKNAQATVLVITSGGKLQEIATANGDKIYMLPKGYQPRMTYGMALGLVMMILSDLLDQDVRSLLEESKGRFENENEKQVRSAEQIFQYFKSSMDHKFVIISDTRYAGIATRFAQQVNENAKLEAFVNVLPEANHNVLESYTDKLRTNFLMIFAEDHPRVAARFDFLISHLEMENNKVLPMIVPKFSFHSLFDLTYRLDWVSVMLADEIGANLDEVPIIMNLKDFLSNLELIEEEFDEEDDSEDQESANS